MPKYGEKNNISLQKKCRINLFPQLARLSSILFVVQKSACRRFGASSKAVPPGSFKKSNKNSPQPHKNKG